MGPCHPFVRLWLLLAALCTAAAPAAGAPFTWPEGKKAAIVLTYDDSLGSQLKVAIPQLNDAGFKGTFFLNGTFSSDLLEGWRKASAAGHELGNHSFFHPCPAASFPAERQFHTEHYSIPGMLREIGAMNTFLQAIDGPRLRTYSVPCSQTLVGGQDYVEALRGSGLIRFVRTGSQDEGIISNPRVLDPFRVPSRAFTEQHSGADLVAWVEEVRRRGGMGVFMFHGVGGDYLAVSADAHRALLSYLQEHRGEVWVATFQQAMEHIVASQAAGAD
jgi:peptidoglycan-N-acetylglucosamine deacetylase